MLTTKKITEILTEFKKEKFHENYRAEDWLLNKLMGIRDEYEKELRGARDEVRAEIAQYNSLDSEDTNEYENSITLLRH